MATTWAHAVYSKESYAPFGETYDEAGTADRSFTGQDQDTVTGSGGTGIYDYLFRKYDPSAGRWLSPDPAGWSVVNQADPQSLDRYAYVENNPDSYVDPFGLYTTCYDYSYYGVSSDGSLTVDVYESCYSDTGSTPPSGPVPPGNAGASNNALQRGLNAFNKFSNACGGRYSTLLGVSDAVGLFGISSYAVSGINALSNTLSNNALQTAGQAGELTGTSAAEVLAHGGAAGETSAVTIAQGASLAGEVLETVGKVSGAITAAATVSSVGIRAGCALGWW